ncbi:unnamed protein product [Clonostachys byssicola]|uniref:Arginine N-methyltransferase 2 n=1 Tax=Clonostachys byssicola TaxID=160290 RepID=A0A9N9XSU3_9HYPO|nr:unnamed protein product [Clonostachys byssicola]
MAKPIDDSMPARISDKCPENIRHILYTTWGHDLDGLKKIFKARPEANAPSYFTYDHSVANAQDPDTKETPLHAAIRACGPAEKTEDGGEEEDDGEEEEDGVVEEASEIIQELFYSGAIWNAVDENDETPGCVAFRLGRKSLYKRCVRAGVQAELLLSLPDEQLSLPDDVGYEVLPSGSEDEGEEAAAGAEDDGDAMDVEDEAPQLVTVNGDETELVPPGDNEKPVTSDEYLKSELTYDDGKLVDSDLNGVMMAWETDIMKRSVAALLPNAPTGKRILNIGFGMGIVDGMFAELKPSRHHIIEAHPAVLEHVAKSDSKFGPSWEKSGPEEGAYKIYAGKWQDVVLKLLEQGEVYDAIYFDTFGEDYSELRTFFSEYLLGLLDEEGRFSFFNGLGADRKICYDVYLEVVKDHGKEAGFDISWEEIDVDMSALAEAGKGEWEGVRRRYWTLDKYMLPIFTFMG